MYDANIGVLFSFCFFHSCSFYKSDSGGNCSRPCCDPHAQKDHVTSRREGKQGDVDEPQMYRCIQCRFEVTVQWKQVCCLNKREEWRDGGERTLSDDGSSWPLPQCRFLQRGCGNRGRTSRCYRYVIFHQEKIQTKISLLGTIRKNCDQEWRRTPADMGVHTLSDRGRTVKNLRSESFSDFGPNLMWKDQMWFVSFAPPMNRQLRITWVRILATLCSKVCFDNFSRSNPSSVIPLIIFASATTHWMCVGK